MSMNLYYPGLIKNKKRVFEGFWWPQNLPEKRRSGNLDIQNGLAPTLIVDSWYEFPPFLQKVEPVTIFGESLEGIPFTLFDCEHSGTSWNNDRIGKSQFIPHIVFWGYHISDIDSFKFKSISIGCEAIHEMDRRNSLPPQTSDGSGPDTASSGECIDIVPPIEIEELGTVRVRRAWMPSSRNLLWKLKSKSWYTLEPKSHFTLMKAIEYTDRLRIITRFLTSKRPNFKIIEFYPENHEVPGGIITIQPKKTTRGRFFDFALQREDNKDAISKIIAWSLKAPASHLDALAAFHYAIDSQSIPFLHRVFDVARIFERMHGVIDSASLVDPEVHSEFIKRVEAQFPENAPEGYRERVLSGLRPMNSRSFRNKIKSYLGIPEIRQIAGESDGLNKFVSRMVKIRNSVAHFLEIEHNDVRWSDFEFMVAILDSLFIKISADVIPFDRRYGVGRFQSMAKK